MGAACCVPIQENENRQAKPTSSTLENRVAFRQQSSRSGRTTARRSGNRNSSSSSSNRDGRSATRRLQTGQLRRPQKINAVEIQQQQQQQQLAPVTAPENSNEANEPPHVLKSNDDKSPSSDCKTETPPDALKEEHKRSDSLLFLPITNDDDFCPTCLEGYERDNPKIHTKCKHHYHLACILEWMERSNTCPICDKEMIIEEAVDTNTVS